MTQKATRDTGSPFFLCAVAAHPGVAQDGVFSSTVAGKGGFLVPLPPLPGGHGHR